MHDIIPILWYCVWYHMCFLVVSRTALSYSRPTPTIRIQCNRLTSRPISTWPGTAWCGMRALKDGVYRRDGEDQDRAAQREQDQGGRDEEASQRGRCRSGGSARRRWSGLNTGLWYHSSYHSQYHIWYHSYDIDYDIIYINMTSWSISYLWYHSFTMMSESWTVFFRTVNRYDMDHDIIGLKYDIIVHIKE